MTKIERRILILSEQKAKLKKIYKTPLLASDAKIVAKTAACILDAEIDFLKTLTDDSRA